MNTAKVSLLAGLFFASPAVVLTGAETRKVVADEQYAAGGFHRFLWGNDYRDLWTTPVTVEVLDLAERGGGPIPRAPGRRRRRPRASACAAPTVPHYTFRGLEKDARTCSKRNSKARSSRSC